MHFPSSPQGFYDVMNAENIRRRKLVRVLSLCQEPSSSLNKEGTGKEILYANRIIQFMFSAQILLARIALKV